MEGVAPGICLLTAAATVGRRFVRAVKYPGEPLTVSNQSSILSVVADRSRGEAIK